MSYLNKNDKEQIVAEIKNIVSQKIIGMHFEGFTVSEVESIIIPINILDESIIDEESSRNKISLRGLKLFSRAWSVTEEGKRSLNIQIQINAPLFLNYSEAQRAYLLQDVDNLSIFLNRSMI